MKKITNISMDDIFVIGDGHNVCEDYSFSGIINDKYPCIIISDGCSSSRYTDIGARILVRAMVSTIDKLKLERNEIEENFHLINHIFGMKIEQSRKNMELPLEALDATIRMALIYDNKVFMFHYGDGSTIVRNHTEDHWVEDFTDYPYNAPFYFNYTTSDYLVEKYKEAYDGQIITMNGKQITVEQEVSDMNLRWDYWEIDDWDAGTYTVSVTSDGMETFFNNNNNISKEEVLEEILAFKNFRGEFVQRKVRKYLHINAKNNIQHYDDICLATLKFEVVDE